MLIRSFAVCTRHDLITHRILPLLSHTLAVFTADTCDEGGIFEKSCINSICYILWFLPVYWISITEGKKHSLEKHTRWKETGLELSGSRVGRATTQFMEFRVHNKSMATNPLLEAVIQPGSKPYTQTLGTASQRSG